MTTATPYVSVIIPAYNPGVYLREAIVSVIAQTFTSWELIVVDDGSSEDLSYVEAMDKRIRLIRQENRGLSAARNAGIMASDAPFVAFLDADDRWLHEKLEMQCNVLQQDGAVAMCHTAFEIINEHSKVTGPGFGSSVSSYLELLRSGCTVCVSSAIVRRSCLSMSGLFDPLYTAVQDYDMWLKLARHSKLQFVPSTQVQYRVHSRNMSGNPHLMAREVSVLLERHRRLAIQRGDHAVAQAAKQSQRQARLGWGCKAYDRCRVSFRQREWRRSWAELRTAIMLAPGYTLRTSLKWPLLRGAGMRGGAA